MRYPMRSVGMILIKFHMRFILGGEYFPDDLSGEYNYQAIYSACCAPENYMEIAFVGCDDLPTDFFRSVYLNGVVKHNEVELLDFKGDLNLRCKGILYRYLDISQEEALRYFQSPEGKIYPESELQSDGYYLLDLACGDNSNLVLTEDAKTTSLTISDDSRDTCSVDLTRNEVRSLIVRLQSALNDQA